MRKQLILTDRSPLRCQNSAPVVRGWNDTAGSRSVPPSGRFSVIAALATALFFFLAGATTHVVFGGARGIEAIPGKTAESTEILALKECVHELRNRVDAQSAKIDRQLRRGTESNDRLRQTQAASESFARRMLEYLQKFEQTVASADVKLSSPKPAAP